MTPNERALATSVVDLTRQYLAAAEAHNEATFAADEEGVAEANRDAETVYPKLVAALSDLEAVAKA